CYPLFHRAAEASCPAYYSCPRHAVVRGIGTWSTASGSVWFAGSLVRWFADRAATSIHDVSGTAPTARFLVDGLACSEPGPSCSVDSGAAIRVPDRASCHSRRTISVLR